MRKTLLLVLPACLFLSTLAFASDVKEQEPKRVLVMYSHHEGLPWEKAVDESLRATLASESTGPVELSVEHADRARNPSDAYLKEFVRLLKIKYGHLQPDVVVGVDDEATEILLKHGEELFPEVPHVFVTAERKELQREFLKDNMTSLSWGLDIKGSVDLICEILPQTSQIFIITGSSPSDRATQRLARQQLRGYTERIKINYLSEITLNDLLEKIARLPERSALLYMTFIKDSEGKSYVPAEMAPDISAKANAPTFSVVGTFIGRGIVGGRLLSAEVQGRRCAEVSLRILGGEAAEDIAPIRTGNVTMFDWRQLRRWGIDESALPQGSIVRFRPPSLWETYRPQMVAGSAGVTILMGALLVVFGQLQLRKKAEKRWREAEENYRSVVENAYEGIVVAQDEKVVFWNDRTLELTGYSAAELSSASFLEFIHPDDRSMVLSEHVRRLSGEVAASRYNIRFLAKDGQCRWAIIGSTQIKWEGRPASLAIISDITQLKKAEEDVRNQREVLARLDRTAALEHLSGSIAHELNQPLTGILGNAQACELLIKNGRAESSELQEIVTDIAGAAKHAGEVIRSLRDFYRTHAVDFKSVDMNSIVRRTLRMLNSELVMRNVHVDGPSAEAVAEVHGSAIQLQQVIFNMITNAYEAIGGAERDSGCIRIAIEPGASEIAVVVEDDGPGIVTEGSEDIFKTLVTSKPGGTGMGLGICRSIIRAHGGRLWAENRPEGGARVGFAIPALREEQ